MGLIGISSPQFIEKQSMSLEDLLRQNFVIVATTVDVVIKLYYENTDPGELLKELLIANDVDEAIALAIVTAAGHFSTIETDDDPSTLANKLPGTDLDTINPVTKAKGKLLNVIIELNDSHKWSREDIAQWIENTFPIEDIAFKTPEEVKSEKGILSKSTKVATIKRIL